jgi:hypothetical protein
MERDGLVTRKVYPEVPPRVEYTLTRLGRTLRQLVRGLVDWSGAHLAEVDAARGAYDARNRRSVKSGPLGRPAPLARPVALGRPAPLLRARPSRVAG